MAYMAGHLASSSLFAALDDELKVQIELGNAKNACNLFGRHLPFIGTARGAYDAAKQGVGLAHRSALEGWGSRHGGRVRVLRLIPNLVKLPS